MTRTRRACSLVVAVSLLFVSTHALADDEAPKADNRARAQQLFDAALALAEAGDFAAACPKFLASQEADPKTSTLLNLANCYEKNGQTASAWGAFREAETLARKIGRADWETNARDRAGLLEPKLLKLTIIVPEESRAPGLVVTRDGAKIPSGEWGVGIPVDPGDHVVGASADGRKTWQTNVALHNGSVSATIPVLETLPAQQETPAPPSPRVMPVDETRSWSTWKLAGAGGVGFGVVALVAGAGLAIVADGNYNDARVRCTAGTRGCPADAVADSEAAYDLATGATIAVIGGAVLIVAGAALFLMAPYKITGVKRPAILSPSGIRW